MRARCPTCKGSGKVIKETMTCPACLGLGKTSFTIGDRNSGKVCEKCKGTGKITVYEKCTTCKGHGYVYYCNRCKRLMERPTKSGLCPVCEGKESPTVYILKPPIDNQLVRKGIYLLGRVEQISRVGIFIQVAPDINVLIRTKDITQDYAWDMGEEVIVKISHINEQGKLFGVPVVLNEYKLESLRGKVRKLKIADLNKDMVGSFISIDAQVVSVLQTSGPTRFTFVDPSGSINGAAFLRAGERAFPEIKEDMVVSVFGEVSTHQHSIQIEIKDMEPLPTKETHEFLREIEEALDKKAAPEDISLSIKSDVLKKLKEDLKRAAKRIRKAVYTGQPIYIRHHADADGTVAGFSLQYALTQLMENEGYDPETIRIRIKRLPNRPPFFDVLDVTKDIDFALEDQKRFGDKLPLFVCLDFGSSTESLLSYLQLKALGLEIIVVDHHFPDKQIKEIVDMHINPYYENGGYELSAGMLGYELARFVYPGITKKLSHLPAIAGIMDKVEGSELEQYLAIANKKNYTKEKLELIGLAVDFELYQLRFSEGTNVLGILFGVEENQEWHEKMVNILGNEAKSLMEQTLTSVLPHCKVQELDNGVFLITIDVELYSHRFTFPNPGKITGLVFDHFCELKKDEAVVTLGEGPDFIILRSKGVLINFPEAVKMLQKDLPDAGVQGGGHEVVGTIKFYEGAREKVKNAFVKHISNLQKYTQES